MATNFCQRHAIFKCGIFKTPVHIIAVVDRMIFTSFIFSSKCYIHTADAEVLKEGRIIGTGAKCIEIEILLCHIFFSCFCIAGVDDIP